MTVRYLQKITYNQSISRRCFPILKLSHIYTLRTVIWLMNNIAINNDSAARKSDSINETALLARRRDGEATETPRRAARRPRGQALSLPPSVSAEEQVTSPVLATLLI